MKDLKYVDYRYIDLPRLTTWVLQDIITAYERRLSSIRTTLDLGITKENVYISGKHVVIRGIEIPIDYLREIITKSDRVYEVTGSGKLIEVTIRNEGIYKLKPIGKDMAPTLEINGIHMHRIVGTTPWLDSLNKVKRARIRRNSRVLDTCMGLGYTAIHSLFRGASQVITVEIDPNVIEIAKHNPWSKYLEFDRVIIINNDVTKVIDYFDENYFDRIIHDPPRITRRYGDLYSLEFYRKLYRVLKPGGILYHYTGEPGIHGGVSIVKGIGDRLRKAGFIVKYYSDAQGYIALKPRY